MSIETTRNDPIVERAASTAHQAVDRVASKVSPTVERVRAAAQGSAETLQARMDTIGSMPSELAQSCRANVRERPMTALGVAVLVGFLLSRWIRFS
jgi:ElaB/YqjD/DUF883 family membrane-anchored ribosome-binding protein